MDQTSNKKEFIVLRTVVEEDNLERLLNNYKQEFPRYSLYQILPEHSYDATFMVVILKRESSKALCENTARRQYE